MSGGRRGSGFISRNSRGAQDKAVRLHSAPVREAPRVDTKQVADAAGVSRATVQRWANAGLLPLPTVYYGLKPSKHSFWADHAPAQARWVANQIAAGRSFEEIRAALAAGEFSVPSPAEDP